MDTYFWHNDPSHKNLYESEIDILTRGLGGDFKLLKLYDPLQENGRVAAIGELMYAENRKQVIKILFPTKYPYSPPKIISVTANLDQSGNIVEPLFPFFFGRGNQYSDGTLCLFRSDFWNLSEHNIGWILRRSQKWLCSASSENGFKPEEIVLEKIAFMNPQGHVLIPKEFDLPPDLKTGKLTLTQFRPNNYVLELNQIPDSGFPVRINNEVFKWYTFEKGITLKSLFPVLDGQNLINIFLKYFGEKIIEGESIKNVAFHFIDDESPWHFFKLNIKIIGNAANIGILYYIGHIINNELYLRTKDIFDDRILLKKRVTIIGLGAIGSEVAKSLAKNGVGHFNLFDKDTFNVGNSVRHAGDLLNTGFPKVDVVKELILRSNPNITVNPFNTDVLDDVGLMENSLNNSDLCICLTAEDSVDYFINDIYSTKYKIPFIFARVSPGAFSGSIQIVNSKNACLRCLSLYGADKLPNPVKPVHFKELPPEYGDCSNPALPGSEIDTKEISIMVARVALQCLFQNESSIYPKLIYSQYYWHGPFGSSEKGPYSWEMKNIPKHPECTICQ